MPNKNIILAIDPGFERLGIAIIEKTKGSKEVLLHSECFKTSATLSFPKRLGLLGEHVELIIDKYSPTHLAIESLFLATNKTTGMHVAEVRGMILYLAERNNLIIHEYTPLQIKVAVAGYGKADKKQVMAMVPRLIHIATPKTSDDELDAIAIGLTTIAYNHL